MLLHSGVFSGVLGHNFSPHFIPRDQATGMGNMARGAKSIDFLPVRIADLLREEAIRVFPPLVKLVVGTKDLLAVSEAPVIFGV